MASVGLPIISWPFLLDHNSPIGRRLFSRLPLTFGGRLDSVGVDRATTRGARLVPDRVKARAPQPLSRRGCLHGRGYPHRSVQQHQSSGGNGTSGDSAFFCIRKSAFGQLVVSHTVYPDGLHIRDFY